VLVVLPPALDPLAGTAAGSGLRERGLSLADAALRALEAAGWRPLLLDAETELTTIGDLPAIVPEGVDQACVLPLGDRRVRDALRERLNELGIVLREPPQEALGGAEESESERGWDSEGRLAARVAAASLRRPDSALDLHGAALEIAAGGNGLVDVFLEHSITWTHAAMFRNLR